MTKQRRQGAIRRGMAIPEWFCVVGALGVALMLFVGWAGSSSQARLETTAAGVGDPIALRRMVGGDNSVRSARPTPPPTRSRNAAPSDPFASPIEPTEPAEPVEQDPEKWQDLWRSPDEAQPVDTPPATSADPPGKKEQPKGNNGVGNGEDPPPPGNPPENDGEGTSPGNPGNKGGANKDDADKESKEKETKPKGNNGVGNGEDPPPPGNPPENDGEGTSPGNPGNKGGAKK